MSISYGGDSVNFADGSSLASGRMGMVNRIINGDCRIDQRNAGAAVTTANSFPVDRFKIEKNSDDTFSAQQDSSAPVGFTKSTKITITGADASIGSTQYSVIAQYIEGHNVADLNWGSANAKTVTLSFWVRSSLTGTFGGSLRNDAGDRYYAFTYSISAADTWEQKSVTIAGDTSGTWLTTTGTGIQLCFSLGAGSSRVATAGSWGAGVVLGASGQTQVISTVNATFYITGIDLRAGTYATAPTWEFRSYQQELALCQRYYWQTAPSSVYMARSSSGLAYNTTGIEGVSFSMPVTMRTAPSFSLASAGFYSPYVGRVPNAGTIGVYQGFPDALYLNNANNGSGFGANYPYWISSSSSNSAKFDAEL